MVKGLGSGGAGDVVGAFVNEAGVSPDDVGEIELRDGEAVVEVDDSVAGDVVEAVDGCRVAGSTVRVSHLDSDVESYVGRYSRLVEMEREEEMERHEREIREVSGRERMEKGRALLDLKGRDEGEGLGGYHVKFVGDGELPETEFGVGDLVMASKNDPLRDDNPTGTVVQKTNYSVTAAFDRPPENWVYDYGVRLDLYVNDVTYQRMLDALDSLRDVEGAREHLRDVVVGCRDPRGLGAAEVDRWFDSDLNESQREAVRMALGSRDFHLVHGPPGTGKTTTLIEVVRQCVSRGESVLVTAASNTAVDNVLEFLVENGVDAVRVGHPARVTPTLREHTLDVVIEDNDLYRRSQELREQAFELLDSQEELTHPSGRWRRGMSDERIKELAREGGSSRGVPPDKIQEMAEWLEIQREADELFDEAEELRDQAVSEILGDAEVVCTTNSTAGSDVMGDLEFDVLVLDEATQATEPSCLIPLTRACRVVMAGDHRQLPPMVLSMEAAREGLRESLFERLAERYPEIVSLLGVQYRMNCEIMKFSSREFYDGELDAAEGVGDRSLNDLDIDLGGSPVLDPDKPLVYVDTCGVDAGERRRPGSTSRENPFEAKLVARTAIDFVEGGVPPGEIAVISPYDDQVDLTQRLLEDQGVEEVEVDTVDGFQGREKDVVLVSLVRSNPDSEIGFLDEARRFNVSLTRARRKAVVVGDSGTVTEADVLEGFVEYAGRNAEVVEA